MKPRLETWRCTSCGRILAKLRRVPGLVLEIKCHCNEFNRLALPEVVPADRLVVALN